MFEALSSPHDRSDLTMITGSAAKSPSASHVQHLLSAQPLQGYRFGVLKQAIGVEVLKWKKICPENKFVV